MKEKLKNIDFKHLFIVLLITLVIGFCVLAICLLNKYDENRSKTILNKHDDLITLNQNVVSYENQYSFITSNIIDDLTNDEIEEIANNNLSPSSFAFVPEILQFSYYKIDLTSLKSNIQLNQSSNNIPDFSSYDFVLNLITSRSGSSGYFNFNLGYNLIFSNNFNLPTHSFVNLQYNDYVTLSIQNYVTNNYFDISLDFNYQYAYIYFPVYMEGNFNQDQDNYDFDINSSYSFSQNLTSALVQNTIDKVNSENTSLRNEVNSLEEDLGQLQSQYNSLDINYQTILEQYNTLLNATDYSFSELFWSISAVPFGVLTSAFNVNVLGINLRGIITGLFTALLLIWLIRRLF